MGQDGGVLNEREVVVLLKRVDHMVPLEESGTRLLVSSKRATYARATVTVLWVLLFSSLFAVAYYSILSDESTSIAYIVPRMAICMSLMGLIVFLRLTDRIGLRWAIPAAVALFVACRLMV